MQFNNRRGSITFKGAMIMAAFGFIILAIIGFFVYKTGGASRVSSALSDSRNGTLSSKEKNKVIHVCVVTWGGYAGGQYFNGGFEATKDSRFYKDYGILVDFPVIDNFDASRKSYQSGECNLLWQTADAFSTEVGNLQKAGFDPRVLFQSDWSRGGDLVVAKRGINSVNDLRGKTVAVGYGTPSHTFLLRMLEAAGMSVNDVKIVQVPSAVDAATAFKSGQVDAAIVWSPDDQDCLKTIPGSKILTSTREATHIIADIFFGEQKWADEHKKELDGLEEGWFKGAAEVNTNPEAFEQAVKILAVGLKQPEDFMRTAIRNARLSTYGDNVNFFNLNGNATGVTGEKLYLETGRLFQASTDLVSSLPPWREITNLDALRSISLKGPENAAEAEERYTVASASERRAEALSVKPLPINFETGSATLSENAKSLLDLFVPTLNSYKNRVRIEGNTDNSGSADVNRRLSLARARAARDYFVNEYHFDVNRFIVEGNGPDKPVATNDTPEGMAKNRRSEFQLIGNPIK
ncbi:MAG: phosphate ABC transporter substrate-binding/OmpA family protein [Minisyncoccia bacterium]